MRVNFGLWFCTILLCPHVACAALTPDRDPVADSMLIGPAPIPHSVDADGVWYHARPIPKHIHQVWFGSRARWFEDANREEWQSTQMWQQYASAFHMGYTMWTEEDVPYLRTMMEPGLRGLFDEALDSWDYTMASDIARLTIIGTLGGMYFDCDMQPPHNADGFLQMDKYLPQKGLVLTTERFARNVGNPGVMVANGFIMASPEHPVIRHMLDRVAANALSMRAVHPQLASWYLVGCVPLSRSLAGVFDIMSLDDLYALGVIHEISPNWLPSP